jgi:hypothetical protein
MTRRSKKQENSSNSVNNGDTALKTPDLNSNREESKTVLEGQPKTSKSTTCALNHNKHKNNAKPNDILKIICQLPKNNSNKTRKNNDRHKQSRQPKPPRHRKCAQQTKKHPETVRELWAEYFDKCLRVQTQQKIQQKNLKNQETDNINIGTPEKRATKTYQSDKQKTSSKLVNDGDTALKTPDLNPIREVSESRTTCALNHYKHKMSLKSVNNGHTALETPVLNPPQRSLNHHKCKNGSPPAESKSRLSAFDHINQGNRSNIRTKKRTTETSQSTKCADNHNKHKNSSNSVNNGDTALKTPDLNSYREESRTGLGRKTNTTRALNHNKHKNKAKPNDILRIISQLPKNKSNKTHKNNDRHKQQRQPKPPRHRKCAQSTKKREDQEPEPGSWAEYFEECFRKQTQQKKIKNQETDNINTRTHGKRTTETYQSDKHNNASNFVNNGDTALKTPDLNSIRDIREAIRIAEKRMTRALDSIKHENSSNSVNNGGTAPKTPDLNSNREETKSSTRALNHNKHTNKCKSELEAIPEHVNIEFQSTKRMHVQIHRIKLKNNHQSVKSNVHTKQKNRQKNKENKKPPAPKPMQKKPKPKMDKINMRRRSQYKALQDSWVEYFDECARQQAMEETQKTPDSIPKQPHSVRPKKNVKKSSQNQSNRQARLRTRTNKPICRPRSKTPKRNNLSSSTTTPKNPATSKPKTKSQFDLENYIREADLQLEKAQSILEARLVDPEPVPSTFDIAHPVPLEERKADCLSMSHHSPDSSPKGHSDENKTLSVSSSWKRPHCFSHGYSYAIQLLEEINQTKIHMLQHFLHPIILTPAAVTTLVFLHATVLAQSINCIIFPPRLFLAAHKLYAPVVSTVPLDSLYKETPFRSTGPGPPLGDSMSKFFGVFFGFLFEFFLSFLNDLKCPTTHTDDCMIK